MKDIALNSGFSMFLDPDTKDIATVEGREAFEQAVIIRLSQLEEGLFGELSSDTLKERVRQLVTRVAREFDEIDRIARLETARSVSNPTKYEVAVTYDTGSTFETEVSL